MRKIVEILQIPKEIQDHQGSLEIIFYLAQETVATIVDFAILTRLNTENRSAEPSVTSNALYMCPEVYSGRAKDGILPITIQVIFVIKSLLKFL